MIAEALSADGDVVCFAHGHVLRVLGARWIEQPPEHGRCLWLQTASISTLGFEHGNRVLLAWNLT